MHPAISAHLLYLIRFERPPSSSSPQRKGPLRLFPQAISDSEQAAVDHGAVIAREFDQLSLGDKAAKLDQLPGAFAPFHLPVPHIGASAVALMPRSRLGGPAQRCRRQFERPCEPRVPGVERSSGRVCASSPFGPRRCFP